MKKEPLRGDMVRVRLGSIYHFGIYVSDSSIIQFGQAPSMRVGVPDSEIEVISSDMDGFLAGGELEVAEYEERDRRRSPDEVVSSAVSRLGERGYNILYNNCEHFANECMSGEHICRQADDVRAMFRNMPIVDVYLAELPDRDADGELSCRRRQEDIDRVSNPKLKREKYYVWKLLEYGLQRSFGLKIAELDLKKTESGRYFADKAEFSLSHSKNALAVAVSRAPVGVDIEPADIAFREGMAKRFMTEREYGVYDTLPEDGKNEFFIKTWTAKEALFKASHKESFLPSTLETENSAFRSFEKTVGSEKYVLSVATGTPERIRIYENIKL